MRAFFLVGFCGAIALAVYGCATAESDVGQGVGGSGNVAGKSIFDGGAARDGGGGTGGGSHWGGSAGAAFGGAGGVSGVGGATTGGSSGVGGVGASGGVGAAGGVGGSTGGVGGSTGGVGGSTGGVGGSTGGVGGSTGGVGGSGGGGVTPPTNCNQAHGLVGCCVNNDVYFWQCYQMAGGPNSCAGQPCGWDAANGWYDCGFTGSDPSGTYPRDCGAISVTPPGCPGCCQGYCGGMSPLGCYCDDACVFAGDCCADACPACGAC